MSLFGEILRVQIERKNLTGQQFSTKIGLSQTSLSKILKGHTKPRHATLNRIIQNICDTREEERLLLNAYSGTSSDLSEERVAEPPMKYQVERESVENDMTMRTQAMSFKNALSRVLSENGFTFLRDYCEGNSSIDFLVETGRHRIALESKSNTSRGLERSIQLARKFQVNIQPTVTMLVVPYIDHLVEATTENPKSTIEIVPLQSVVAKLKTFTQVHA